MNERVACRTPGCTGTILSSTAEATGGLCKPCVNRATAEQRRLYIDANRVDVDRFAGVTDVVEVLHLIHRPPPADPLVKLVPYERSLGNLYRGLQTADAERLVSVAKAN